MKNNPIYFKVCLWFVLPVSIIVIGYCVIIAIGGTIDSQAIDQDFKDNLEQRDTSIDEFTKDWEAKTGRKWQGNE